MVIYTSDGCCYTGMSEETVVALRTEIGKTTTLISEQDYLAILEQNRVAST